MSFLFGSKNKGIKAKLTIELVLVDSLQRFLLRQEDLWLRISDSSIWTLEKSRRGSLQAETPLPASGLQVGGE